MTDKQIIDGVDVSECEFYFYRESDEYPHRCSCYKDMYGCSVVCNLADCCENCVYKQLKRKEQENEWLKNSSDEWMSKCEQETKLREFVDKQLDQLEAENDKLKQTLAEIKYLVYELTNEEYMDFIKGKQERILQLISEVENDRQS